MELPPPVVFVSLQLRCLLNGDCFVLFGYKFIATFVPQQTAMELQVIIWVTLNSLVLAIPSGWYGFESAEYFFSSDTLDWTDAKGACEGLGGALYVPSDYDTEYSFVRTTLGTDATDWWIGVNDLAEELVFRDTNDNLVTYTDWFPGFPHDSQPTEGETDQDCVELLREFNKPVFLTFTKLTDVGRFYWNDTPCSGKQKYICKKIPGGIIATTTATTTTVPTPQLFQHTTTVPTTTTTVPTTTTSAPTTITTTTVKTTIVSTAVETTIEPTTSGPPKDCGFQPSPRVQCSGLSQDVYGCKKSNRRLVSNSAFLQSKRNSIVACFIECLNIPKCESANYSSETKCPSLRVQCSGLSQDVYGCKKSNRRLVSNSAFLQSKRNSIVACFIECLNIPKCESANYSSETKCPSLRVQCSGLSQDVYGCKKSNRRLVSNSAFLQSKRNSIVACFIECLNIPKCESANYSSETKVCELFTIVVGSVEQLTVDVGMVA
ncbi:hypothetical protein CAPTEDRAFT_192860 [Capitella teleta]|uniref:C-type lectin domain-containing protein n=1 Tax=Capitella teleta TaxID=283909 RepID=R7U7Q9_CAPTE|nr:hypothetical protein CAPTEDRAFT_192860 [Capitella teleta]|eukprot:ELU01989.1 hypothetical protein CAPTEDRAFT_192860 [Capitella teleta]